MATQSKRRKKAETDRANSLAAVLTSIEAGDHRPAVKNFYTSGCMAGIGEVMARRIAHSPEVHSVSPSHENGVVFDAPRGMVHVVECQPVDAMWRQRLALQWGKVASAIPARLCCVASVYINSVSGAVGGMKRDYRWLPPGTHKDRGWNWFPFPLNEAGHVVGYRRDRFGTLVPVYDTAAGGGSVHDHSCSMAPALIRLFEVAQTKFWTVSLAAFGCETRLTIFTSSSGVKGFFDLRQKGSANRRSALQHWVRQHTRKVSGDDVTEVKRHLRGQTEFEWFGLTGRVHVPEEQRVLSGA